MPRTRAVIITGAGNERGIGFAAARLLGADVLVNNAGMTSMSDWDAPGAAASSLTRRRTRGRGQSIPERGDASE